ncbi:uncharacterized protein LOC134527390 isoform X2 [Bacillus rossius redtenbacheri]
MSTPAAGESDRRALSNISVKLTEETLLEVLRMFAKREDVCVSGYKVRPAMMSEGDSYQSSVSRIVLEGSSTSGDVNYSVSLIVKGLTPNICRRKTFRTVEFFANEIAFYEKAWPKLLAFQEKLKPEHPFTEIPRCYKTLADGENDFIILEDLAPDGYQIPPRSEGLDYAHCFKILATLARFHALSLALRDQDPGAFLEVADSVQEIFYKAELKPWYGNLMRDLIDVALDAMAKEMPGSIYEEKLCQFTAGDLYCHLAELVADSREPHGVLSHGDVWTANLMCRYEAGGTIPLDTKLVDFQLARCSSPALDLSMFFYSCTLQDLREKHYDALVRGYHDTLARSLTELGSRPDVYPLAVLLRELTLYAQYGLGIALEAVPVSLFDEHDAVCTELQGDQAVPLETVLVVRPIRHREGRMRLCNNVKHMVDCGYL